MDLVLYLIFEYGLPRVFGRLPQYLLVKAVIVLGDASVGKTCIIQNYTKGTTGNISYKPTLGIDYSSKNIDLNNHTIKAQIWDTAGQENYRSITVEYRIFYP